LLSANLSDEEKKEGFRHNLIGVVLYGLATAIAPFLPFASAIAMVVVPMYYITPRLLHDHDDH